MTPDGKIMSTEETIDALRAENERLLKLLEDIRNNAWPGKAFGARIDAAITRGQPVDNVPNILSKFRFTIP